MFTAMKNDKGNADHMTTEGNHSVDAAKEEAHHFKNDACDAAAAVKDDLENVARRTGHHMRELTDSAEHSLKDIGGTMTIKIRENPVQSSLIALGAGLVAGMLLRR